MSFINRRKELAKRLGVGGIAIIPTATEHIRNRDSHYPYRPDSYFYYMTGFSEPNSLLVITADGASTLFCQPKDQEREIWDGYRLGPDEALKKIGVEKSHSISELDAEMPSLLENQKTIWYPFATHPGLETQIDKWLHKVRARVRLGAMCPGQQNDLCALIDEMRLIKEDSELATMRRAAKISAAAHVRTMQLSYKMQKSGADLREFHLEAELLHEFRRNGSEFPAYGSIVAAGANACVLHYQAGSTPIKSGELVLIDAGCELNGYASDITRTFPANGSFSGPQLALYECVLAAHAAAVEQTRAGHRFTDPHDAAVKVLSQGLLDLGLLNPNLVGSLDDVIENRDYFRFYMHRTSHWLGMDVHDCGSYIEPSESANLKTKTDPIPTEIITQRPSRILRPGMVMTIEPGLYIRPAADVPDIYWNIGIRIEDDAVITSSECELITSDVPTSPKEIEMLMRH
jgi:Xaa-Pro aminopeptidase